MHACIAVHDATSELLFSRVEWWASLSSACVLGATGEVHSIIYIYWPYDGYASEEAVHTLISV